MPIEKRQRVVLGVDPGRTDGSGVVILVDGNVQLVHTIKPKNVTGKTAHMWVTDATIYGPRSTRHILAIEASPYMPFKNALKSLWHQVGGWEWLAEAAGMELVRVAPRSWQAALVAPKQGKHVDQAEAAVTVARARWPDVAEWNEHTAAAALIALYVHEGIHEMRAAQKKLWKEGYR